LKDTKKGLKQRNPELWAPTKLPAKPNARTPKPMLSEKKNGLGGVHRGWWKGGRKTQKKG